MGLLILDKLDDYRLLKNDSIPWSWQFLSSRGLLGCDTVQCCCTGVKASKLALANFFFRLASCISRPSFNNPKNNRWEFKLWISLLHAPQVQIFCSELCFNQPQSTFLKWLRLQQENWQQMCTVNVKVLSQL
jgi:hypothetical protein